MANEKRDWSVKDALDLANTLANHGWTGEANADVASSCIYAMCRMLKDGGNAAKLREALESILNLAYEVDDENADGWCRTSLPTDYVIDTIKAALAAPPRQCDIGTAEEQTDRFKDLCRKYRRGPGPRANCKGCPIQHESPHVGCTFAWAQIPYNERKAENG